ncbi:hypothetical protein AVM02_03220 [Brucella anthropi]
MMNRSGSEVRVSDELVGYEPLAALVATDDDLDTATIGLEYQMDHLQLFEPKVRSAYAGKSVHWTDFRSRFDASNNALKQIDRAVPTIPLKPEPL